VKCFYLIVFDGCNDLVMVTFDFLLIRDLNEANLSAIITKFSYAA